MQVLVQRGPHELQADYGWNGVLPMRLPMRHLREILRLKHEGRLSHRAIALACSVGVGTVSEYTRRARETGLCWPLPEDLADEALEAMLFRTPLDRAVVRRDPDFAWVHRELRRVVVTLQLLWHEVSLPKTPSGHDPAP